MLSSVYYFSVFVSTFYHFKRLILRLSCVYLYIYDMYVHYILYLFDVPKNKLTYLRFWNIKYQKIIALEYSVMPKKKISLNYRRNPNLEALITRQLNNFQQQNKKHNKIFKFKLYKSNKTNLVAELIRRCFETLYYKAGTAFDPPKP